MSESDTFELCLAATLPHDAQEFLTRLSVLPIREWLAIRDRASARLSAALEPAFLAAAYLAAGSAVRRGGRLPMLRDLWAGVQAVTGSVEWCAQFQPDGDPITTADLAALDYLAMWASVGLLVRDRLPACQFRALYAPFADAIPADSLPAAAPTRPPAAC